MPKCKSKTKFLPATFAWILLLGTTSLFFVFPCVNWYVRVQQWYPVPIFQGILTLFVLINFSMATFMDPGVIPRASPDEDRDDDFRAPLYRNVEINNITVRMKWCVTCQFYRPPRCSHCSVCNNCIEIFDHHCPWVNNCIGRRNYRYFFMFLISLSLHMTSIFILSLVHVLHRKEFLSEMTVVVSLVVMCIIALLFIPIFGLTGFHIVLVARGRTTNEQVTGKFRGGYNPFSKSCLHNCCFALCGPQYPSLKNPAKFIGKKPRKYTVPVQVKQETPAPAVGRAGSGSSGGGPGGVGPGGVARSSGRLRGQGVEPIAAQAAAAAQVRTYRDNGIKHSSSSYNRMSAASEMDAGSDMDEPMASQSKDAEPSLSHNNSKSNFFPEDDPRSLSTRADDSINSRSGVNTSIQLTSNPVSSPYQSGARILQQGYNSPHILQKPLKRSGTPEHMLSETGVEMRQLPRHHTTTQSPTVTASKVRVMGGVATPLAGAPPPTVSSPGRYSGLTTPMYSHAAAAGGNTPTYNPGYQPPSRRYLSEGELLEPHHPQMIGPAGVGLGGTGVGPGMGMGVGPSTSAGHLQDLAGSPNKSFYLWKTDGGSASPPVASYAQHMAHPHGSTAYTVADTNSPNHGGGGSTGSGGGGSGHSYAQQVGYYLQQQPVSEFLAPSIQSGGPRTTPSGYPGGPMVPPGHVSPKMSRRMPPPPPLAASQVAGGGGGVSSSPYSENVIRTNASPQHHSPQQGPMSFTRALEVTDKHQLRSAAGVGGATGVGGGGRPQPPIPAAASVNHGAGGGGLGSNNNPNNGGGVTDSTESNRESLYDVNYEISV